MNWRSRGLHITATRAIIAGAVTALWLSLAVLSAAGANPDGPAPRHPAEDALSIATIADRVAERYRGRLIAGEIKRATPRERRLGADHVYDLRLLTPAGAVLRLILDARTGAFLEVSGRGQIEARKKAGETQ